MWVALSVARIAPNVRERAGRARQRRLALHQQENHPGLVLLPLRVIAKKVDVHSEVIRSVDRKLQGRKSCLKFQLPYVSSRNWH